MNILEEICELSREFGVPAFVQGGGGNSSAKDATTLWVKPSGVGLAQLTPDVLLPLDRGRLAAVLQQPLPDEAHAREAIVSAALLAAVTNGSRARPSVESLLHNLFEPTFVVHTHPALVNGMTCARDGEAACRRLFPEALWIPYANPGSTLSVTVARAIAGYRGARGRGPELVVLQSHGIFVAAREAAHVRALYRDVMAVLDAAYEAAGVPRALAEGPVPGAAATPAFLAAYRAARGGEAPVFASAGGRFEVMRGPVSPDHIVFVKSYAFTGPLTAEALARFRAQHGYEPRVAVTGEGVFGLGTTQKDADLSLAVARDGAFVQYLTRAFGGTRYMTDEERGFIENWEMERYRQKVAAG